MAVANCVWRQVLVSVLVLKLPALSYCPGVLEMAVLHETASGASRTIKGGDIGRSMR